MYGTFAETASIGPNPAMSNETARIRRIAFAAAVFRSIVTANASGFTRKDRRQKGPDSMQGRTAGPPYYAGFSINSQSLMFSR